MYRRRFERLVARAIRELPADVTQLLDNVGVVVADNPSPDELAGSGEPSEGSLFGLYQGIPLTERGFGYSMVLPDKITIFQAPIERYCGSDAQIMYEVKRTVVHELAHHFGLSEADLRRLRR